MSNSNRPHQRLSPAGSVSSSPNSSSLFLYVNENRDTTSSSSACFTVPSTQVMNALAMVRNRLFLLFLLSLVFCSSLFVFSATNGTQRARIHSLVTETQQQITDHIKKNFKDEGEDAKDSHALDVEARYLDLLGLEIDDDEREALEVRLDEEDGDEESGSSSSSASISQYSPPPPLWPDSPWRSARNVSEPVILSAVQAGHAGEAVHFLRNTQLFLPNHTVILYDLGLGSHELTLVEQYCNTSLCTLKRFDSSLFPGHVRNYRTSAFRFVKRL